MHDLKHDISLRAAEALNAVLITIPFIACWYGYYAPRLYSPFYRKGNWAVIALFVAVYLTYAKVYDALQVSLSRIPEMTYSQGLAAFITDAILYVVTYLLTKFIPDPLPLMAAFIFQVVFAFLWSIAANRWYFFMFPPKRTAIVYDKRPELEAMIGRYRMEKKFDILAAVTAAECLGDLSMLENMEVVFLGGVHSHDRNTVLKYCMEHGIDAYVIPRIGDTIMSGAKQTHMFHLPILSVDWCHPRVEYLFMKRAMDIAVSAAALVLALPLMLLTAVFVHFSDGGPVFYKQERLTKDGKRFRLIKFRSMCVDAEEDGVARLSTGGNDPRITPVGRVIRRFRIDELPQFFNVLRGDMSLVGPRPERPEIAELYTEELPEFSLRLKAKAGLTGYAQVYGKYNTEPYDKLQMDLMYLAHPSIIEDLRILFSTVKILFMPESTEGIEEGQTTAVRNELPDACKTKEI